MGSSNRTVKGHSSCPALVYSTFGTNLLWSDHSKPNANFCNMTSLNLARPDQSLRNINFYDNIWSRLPRRTRRAGCGWLWRPAWSRRKSLSPMETTSRCFFFHIFGVFYERIWQNYKHNALQCSRVIKLLFSSPGEYGPTSSPGNWSVLTSLCQIEILHLEASGMYWVRLQLHLFSLSCNDLFLDLYFACSSSRDLYFFQTSFFFSSKI